MNNTLIVEQNLIQGGLTDAGFTWYWSLMLNIWFLGYLVGTFLTPYFCDNLGRKSKFFIRVLLKSIFFGAEKRMNHFLQPFFY